MVAKAKKPEYGITHLALELDGFHNDERWVQFANSCVGGGIAPGVWFTSGGNIVATPPNAHFTIAEDEGPDDYQGIIDAIPQLRPDLPRAIITNFASYVQNGKDDKELAKPLIDAGFACITEVYLGDNVMATPENMQGRANNLGWEKTQPGFGVWNKWWEEYKNWFGWWPGHWFYLAENFVR